MRYGMDCTLWRDKQQVGPVHVLDLTESRFNSMPLKVLTAAISEYRSHKGDRNWSPMMDRLHDFWRHQATLQRQFLSFEQLLDQLSPIQSTQNLRSRSTAARIQSFMDQYSLARKRCCSEGDLGKHTVHALAKIYALIANVTPDTIVIDRSNAYSRDGFGNYYSDAVGDYIKEAENDFIRDDKRVVSCCNREAMEGYLSSRLPDLNREAVRAGQQYRFTGYCLMTPAQLGQSVAASQRSSLARSSC